MICCYCEQRKKASKKDPEFCQECYNDIENRRKNVMKHADAVVGLSRHTNMTRKENVAAFLGVFHPEMNQRRVHKILSLVKG